MAATRDIRAQIAAAGPTGAAMLLRALIGGAFVWAGAAKALDPAAFASAIEGFRLLPRPWAALVALYLPWLEIVAGASLLLPRVWLTAAAVLLPLVTIFIGAIGSAWLRGLDVTCGCFGGTGGGDYGSILLRNAAIAVLLVGLFIFAHPNRHEPARIATRRTGVT